MRRKPLDLVLYLAVGLVILGGAVGLLDAIIAPSAAASGRNPAGRPVGLTNWIFNPVSNVQRMNLLLVGADDRTIAGHFEKGRADTIMLVCLSPKQHRMAIFSLPRDFLVTIPQAPKGVQSYPQKINHAYAFGGAPLIRSTVEHTLGIQVDYYLKTDLKSFAESVDMLGGVDIDVPDIEGQGRGMNYDDSWGNLHIHLKPGLQHLNGVEAEGFVRYRKSKYRNAHGDHFGITDMERASNQQIFLKAILEQKMKLTNLPTLMRVGGHILGRLDTDMEWRTAVGLMQVMRGMDTNEILQLTVPIQDKWMNGVYYCTAPPEKIQEQDAEIDAFLSGVTPLPAATTGTAASQPASAASRPLTAAPKPKPAPKPQPLKVQVLNGSGVAGAAKAAAELLERRGYKVTKTGNAASGNRELTSVTFAKDKGPAADLAGQYLDIAHVRKKSGQTAGADLIITLGRDFDPSASRPTRSRP